MTAWHDSCHEAFDVSAMGDKIPLASILALSSLLSVAFPISMAEMDASNVPGGGQRKEIYTYSAPWTVFAMAWSHR